MYTSTTSTTKEEERKTRPAILEIQKETSLSSIGDGHPKRCDMDCSLFANGRSYVFLSRLSVSAYI